MDHETKVALKQDAFVDTTAQGIEWASENRASLIRTSVLALSLLAIALGAFLFYNNRSSQASVALGAAMADYQTPLAQPGEPVPPGTKTYASSAERAKAANAAFTAVADKYGMTSAGHLARYFAGVTAVEEGQNASAESALKEVSSGWNRDLANLANVALAQLYRQTGRDAQAIEVYKQIIDKPSSTVPAGLAQLQLADLYESENKPEEAKKIYAKLKDTDAKGQAGTIAAQKLGGGPSGPQLQ